MVIHARFGAHSCPWASPFRRPKPDGSNITVQDTTGAPLVQNLLLKAKDGLAEVQLAWPLLPGNLQEAVLAVARIPNGGQPYMEEVDPDAPITDRVHLIRESVRILEAGGVLPGANLVVMTRVELYERVWSVPATKLAREIGVSDVAIVKACRWHGVPKPEVGYWAKLGAGLPVERPALPAAEDGHAERVEFHLRAPSDTSPNPSDEPRRGA